MMKTSPTIDRYGDTVVVTARNAQEAQQAAMDTLGAGCTVTSVERVRSGGVGGFFATELVRLTATTARTAPHTAAAEIPYFAGSDTEMEAVLASAEDLVASLNRRTSGFAERLLDELGTAAATPTPGPIADAVAAPAAAAFASSIPGPDRNPDSGPESGATDPVAALLARLMAAEAATAASPAAPAAPDLAAAPAAVIPPAPAIPRFPAPAAGAALAHTEHMAHSHTEHMAPAPRSLPRHSSSWSAAALRVIGVPDSLVDEIVRDDPQDDVEWLVALMTAIKPLCATPKPTASLVVGPACANLARQLRYMSITAEELAETVSSVAVPHISAKELMASADGRTIHLVVGGAWQHLVTVPATVVSAASDGDLMDALRAAAAWGASLGWMWTGDRYERIDPFTIATLIRQSICATEAPASIAAPATGADTGSDRVSGSPDDQYPIR